MTVVSFYSSFEFPDLTSISFSGTPWVLVICSVDSEKLVSYHAGQLILPCVYLQQVEEQGLTVWVHICARVLVSSSITSWRGKGGLEHRLVGQGCEEGPCSRFLQRPVSQAPDQKAQALKYRDAPGSASQDLPELWGAARGRWERSALLQVPL